MGNLVMDAVLKCNCNMIDLQKCYFSGFSQVQKADDSLVSYSVNSSFNSCPSRMAVSMWDLVSL